MKSKLFVLLSMILIVFYSCNREEIFREQCDVKNIVNIAKFEYQTKFKNLKHFNDYLSTPLWNDYISIEDSTNQYIYLFKKLMVLKIQTLI